MDDLIEVSEVCQHFDCTELTVVVMLRDGRLPGVKFGRDWRIPRHAFWQRVNEMALEQAAQRRADVAAQQPVAQGPHASSNPAPAHTYRGRGRPRTVR
jgi:excisionase family DNA binding protein